MTKAKFWSVILKKLALKNGYCLCQFILL